MKKCLPNKMIESLALGNQMPETDDHLKNCSLCRNRIEIAKDFFRQMEMDLASSLSQREINLAESLESPIGKWIATPVQTMTPTLRPSVYAAASTIDLPKREIQRVGLLATPDKEILIRVLRYTSSGQVKLFLISKHKHKTELVLIKIPAIGFEGVTDKSGEVSIGKIDPSDWEMWQIEVQTASAIYTVTAMEDSEGRIRASRDVSLIPEVMDSITIECTREVQDSTLSVHVSKLISGVEDQNPVYRILVTRGDIMLKYQTTESSDVHFPGIPCQTGLQIRVFD
ncbi:MAG: hypothetical protein GXO90_07655 [FCB group bacterium]|nr:hypothetical protein [FCB group bacterium]